MANLKRYLNSFLRKSYKFLFFVLDSIWDARLGTSINVKESGKNIFKVLDYGNLVRMRAKTFETKEPETLDWIRSFEDGDNFLDIGANIGIYSLYAAYKGINVIAVEPDALNYALLNLNIRVNNFGNKIMPYCIAIHDVTRFSRFNISDHQWGGACNSFDNNLDYKGDEYNPIHTQGIFGTSLDSLLKSLNLVPNHLKIDVDGNEYLTLLGAEEFLLNKSLKSILIELDETKKNYLSSLQIIEQSGFTLAKKTHSAMFDQGKFSTIYNHIFIR